MTFVRAQFSGSNFLLLISLRNHLSRMANPSPDVDVDYYWVGFVNDKVTTRDVATGPHLFKVTNREVHCVIVDGLDGSTGGPAPIPTENDPVLKSAHVSLTELGLTSKHDFYAWYPFGYWQLLRDNFEVEGGTKLTKLIGAVAGRCLRVDQSIENPAMTFSEMWRLYQLPYTNNATTPVLVYCMSLNDYKGYKTVINKFTDEKAQANNTRPSLPDVTRYGESFEWIRLKEWIQPYFCYATEGGVQERVRHSSRNPNPSPHWNQFSQDFFGILFQAKNYNGLRLLLETLLMVRYNDPRSLKGVSSKAIGRRVLLRWNDISDPEWERAPKTYPRDEDVKMGLDAIMDDGSGVETSPGIRECLTVETRHNDTGSFNRLLTPLKVMRKDTKDAKGRDVPNRLIY